MKITETRKKIIELIQPFMDKEISDGCLFIENKYKSKGSDMINNSIDGIQKIAYVGVSFCDNFRNNRIIFANNFGDISVVKNEIKIIGKYNISAVLKYMEVSKGCDIDYSEGHYYFYKDVDTGCGCCHNTECIGEIISESLDNYNEDQDKKLLKILEK